MEQEIIDIPVTQQALRDMSKEELCNLKILMQDALERVTREYLKRVQR